jgi:hypothetical protein
MRRLFLMLAALAAAAVLVAGFASSAGAYGGGASHDMWQIGISGNCNNPSFCVNEEGQVELGGFWGWFEFDQAGTSTWGDAQVTGCGHGIGGAGSFGADHADVDITAWHMGAPQQDDPNFGTPGAQVFYIDSNVVNGEPNNPDFLGDSGIPVEPGHYSFHPVAGVAFMIQVAFRPAK